MHHLLSTRKPPSFLRQLSAPSLVFHHHGAAHSSRISSQPKLFQTSLLWRLQGFISPPLIGSVTEVQRCSYEVQRAAQTRTRAWPVFPTDNKLSPLLRWSPQNAAHAPPPGIWPRWFCHPMQLGNKRLLLNVSSYLLELAVEQWATHRESLTDQKNVHAAP